MIALNTFLAIAFLAIWLCFAWSVLTTQPVSGRHHHAPHGPRQQDSGQGEDRDEMAIPA